jgi:ankyrin repeat protein
MVRRRGILRVALVFFTLALLAFLAWRQVRAARLAMMLYQAAWMGDLTQVESLLARGADINAKNKAGATPLHKAAAAGHTEVVKALIVKGANVDARDKKGRTSLHEAVGRGRVEAAETLIAARADLNSRDDNGCTPLLIAAEGDFYVDEVSVPVRLPSAIKEGRCAIGRELIAAGADVNVTNRAGECALNLAARSCQMDLVRQLVSHGSSVRTSLYDAARGGSTEVVTLLLAAGADVNMRSGPYDGTPLHAAVLRGHLDVVNLLITHGADVNLVDTMGGTPLHVAASGGYYTDVAMPTDKNIVQTLIAAGADLNPRDRQGWTPLRCAEREKHKDIVELLVSAGAREE